MDGGLHRAVERLANGMALLGGLVLTLLIALTCVSVAGRALNTLLHGGLGNVAPGVANWALDLGVGPIKGDFEIVEVGVAFAIFAFLPICQLTAGHAVVDIFTSKLPSRADRVLRMVIDVVFAAALVLIAVQLYGGMMSKLGFGDNTFILQFPVWWGYAASLCAAVVGAIVGVYVAGVRVYACATGKDVDL